METSNISKKLRILHSDIESLQFVTCLNLFHPSHQYHILWNIVDTDMIYNPKVVIY